MAEHKHGSMNREQNEDAWVYFTNFWKYFFAICIVGLILLAMITL